MLIGDIRVPRRSLSVEANDNIRVQGGIQLQTHHADSNLRLVLVRGGRHIPRSSQIALFPIIYRSISIPGQSRFFVRVHREP